MDGEAPLPLNILSTDSHASSEFADYYLQAAQLQPSAMTAAFLVGHTTLRLAHMDGLGRAATDAEPAAMAAA